ncbi:MAG: GAF domain-containing sensor histidine kinase [Opitutales bacterium]|jgi:signal transduction histidine kinase|nr:GAF domain-containing sensor histidine kinase [Opitutales bacterium]MDP4643111.1 GAF domain-containing sensor histidine kinase [Opitutales bacterium]MDP4693246.1 GAF domain-containing sensor histidine kinase [Opitutales bacterium]MDP4776342.1 GAF domain-containing sensor histidine kinase [Opitutales bacterium]MDP4880297.1 GAF domain-containing sensor histidine kinase [Opitutales bacterium]
MKEAKLHPEEEARLCLLRELGILDTAAEKEYDDLVSLVASICDVPIALVSLVDESRQWFKAKVGLDADETPRAYSFCAHGILGSDILEISNALEDDRFVDNPLVTGAPGIRFYAGAPLVTESGLPLGSLCVIDVEPRKLTQLQRQALKVLSNQVSTLLELRLANQKLAKSNDDLDDINRRLNEFFRIVSHDLRSPFNGLIGVTELLKTELESLSVAEVRELVSALHKSSAETFIMLEKLMDWSKFEVGSMSYMPVTVQVRELAENAVGILAASLKEKRIEFTIDIDPDVSVLADATMLATIIRNLASNALKFTPNGGSIRIIAQQEHTAHVWISVVDSGVGMTTSVLEMVRSNVSPSSERGTDGEQGHGLGLQLVHQFLAEHGSELEVESDVGKGSVFRFKLPLSNAG